MSSNVVIVYHSGYGHTARIAEAVAAGSGATLLPIDAEGQLPEGGWEVLDKASTIVFGTPTYMGNVSWQFKRFAAPRLQSGRGRAGKTRSLLHSPIRRLSPATSRPRCTPCSHWRSNTACCGPAPA